MYFNKIVFLNLFFCTVFRMLSLPTVLYVMSPFSPFLVTLWPFSFSLSRSGSSSAPKAQSGRTKQKQRGQGRKQSTKQRHGGREQRARACALDSS